LTGGPLLAAGLVQYLQPYLISTGQHGAQKICILLLLSYIFQIIRKLSAVNLGKKRCIDYRLIQVTFCWFRHRWLRYNYKTSVQNRNLLPTKTEFQMTSSRMQALVRTL